MPLLGAELQPEARELVGRAAAAEPDRQPAAGQGVERGQLLGDRQRVVERQDDQRRADRDAPRPPGRRERQQERLRRQALMHAEVVLGQPERLEPQLVRQRRLREELLVDDRRRPPLVLLDVVRDDSSQLHPPLRSKSARTYVQSNWSETKCHRPRTAIHLLLHWLKQRYTRGLCPGAELVVVGAGAR